MTDPPPGARRACPHLRFSGAPCRGVLTATGHCDACGRAATDRTASTALSPGPEQLLQLPELPGTEPTLLPPGHPLPFGKRCGAPGCGRRIGPPLVLGPVPLEGHCPSCGARYSFVPPLREHLVLGGQYRVRGTLAHGGQGWVHLADDTHLDNTPVAVKGLLNRHDAGLQRLAREERRYLIAINHPGTVRILDYIHHQHPKDPPDRPTAYIVMEYVSGSTLDEIVTRTRAGERPLGVPLDIEHVLTYGCLVLEALAHLHSMGLVHGDMKPSNVIHHRDRIKIIDLGGVRRDGEREPGMVTTPGYAAPESAATGPTVAHDLHAVGRTLQQLARYARTNGVPPQGLDSLRRALERATHRWPGRRFGTADEMAGQLRGVLREIRALRGKHDQPEPSAHFTRSTVLTGGNAGAVPDFRHWLRRPVPSRREPRESPPLDLGAPTARAVALGLPVPVPHPADPEASRFGLTSYDPDLPLRQPDGEPSAEVGLHNLRRLLRQSSPLARADAAAELAGAARILGVPVDLRWRLSWHQGLLRLVRADDARRARGPDGPEERGHLAAARRSFAAVHHALPGDYAAKLALGYCQERLGAARPTADELYEAVRARNPSHGTAAFALARTALARGDRERALRVLEEVPEESRDHRAARIAAIRIQAARLAPGPGGLPGPDGLLAALRTFVRAVGDPRLHLAGETGERLRTELCEWALDIVCRAPDHPATEQSLTLLAHTRALVYDRGHTRPAGEPTADRRARRPGRPATGARSLLRRLVPDEPLTPERRARFLLEEAYRDLAAFCAPEGRERLADLAQSVRPGTRF
ncbi:tetratricopeptide repeat protein [Streptomyces sp. NPDC050504]|uniref:serine/threonine-protein kinase n=1 Tax=Streptomyces sp. NPDC050504 TaxID=3365618 RepID=UPI003797A24E